MGEEGDRVGRGANVLMWNIPFAAKGKKGADDLPPPPHSSRDPPGFSTKRGRIPLQHPGGRQQGKAGPGRCQLTAVGCFTGPPVPPGGESGFLHPPPKDELSELAAWP